MIRPQTFELENSKQKFLNNYLCVSKRAILEDTLFPLILKLLSVNAPYLTMSEYTRVELLLHCSKGNLGHLHNRHCIYNGKVCFSLLFTSCCSLTFFPLFADDEMDLLVLLWKISHGLFIFCLLFMASCIYYLFYGSLLQ